MLSCLRGPHVAFTPPTPLQLSTSGVDKCDGVRESGGTSTAPEADWLVFRKSWQMRDQAGGEMDDGSMINGEMDECRLDG
jgi:hypothetical protein